MISKFYLMIFILLFAGIFWLIPIFIYSVRQIKNREE